MTVLTTTNPMDATKIAAAPLPAAGLRQDGVRGNAFALAERCAR
jgi:hypothetical protein